MQRLEPLSRSFAEALPRLALLTLLSVAACGGGAMAPTKAPPSAAPSPAATPVAKVAPAPPPSPSTPPAETAPRAPPQPEPTPEPVTPVADRILVSSAAYMIRYDDSAPKQAAEAACVKAGDDPDARSQCLEKERSRFVADVLRFHKDDKETSLTIYRRQGNTLQELSKSVVELGEQTPERLTLKVKSDKGTRPLFAGKKALTISSSNDSTSNIELDDPRFGKLIYEARIGLVDDAR